MKNFSREMFVAIATEMYHVDSKIYSESYSQSIWEERGWPKVDDKEVYAILDSYIKFLRMMDKYEGKETRDSTWRSRDILGRLKDY